MPDRPARSITQVVANDLCIGCGLCQALAGDTPDATVTMTMTGAGSLRPTPPDGLRPEDERRILTACPGVVAAARDHDAPDTDPVWGRYRSMVLGWAGDRSVRHRASTGGVLTALGQHALRSGRVAAVLHVGPDPARPTRTRAVLSETVDEVLANSGSRYGPTAPLTELGTALDRGQPFAVIAKPCDLGAIDRLATIDDRVDRLCTVRLAMVCGGQSRATKTSALLDRFGVTEAEVAELRYRGDGNPGPTRVRTSDGRIHQTTYLDLWADEAGWDLETRCKLCPDALGECADVVAADAWPGGAPIGEDEGSNAVVVRTEGGAALVDEAVAAGSLVLGDPLTPAELDHFQPHQVARKEALATRYEGMAAAGVPPIVTKGLRIDELGARFTGDRAAEREGTARRLEENRLGP